MRSTPLAARAPITALGIALGAAASLAGCTYPAVPTATPAQAAPQQAAPQPTPGPGARVPGTFQLDIGQANLRREIDLHGISCMLAHFPVDAASAFSRTVQDTVGQVVERVELVAAAPAAGGAARPTGGAISVLPSRFSVDVDADQGFTGVDFRGRTTLTANVTVDGPGGNATFAVEGSGTGSGRNSLIGDCDTIATVGGQAVQAALADLARHLREQLANAPQIRPRGGTRGARR